MSQAFDTNLADALSKAAPVVITVAWQLGQFHLRSKFVPDARGAMIERPTGQGGEPLLDKAVAAGTDLVLNFRGGSSNYRFSCKLTPSPESPKVFSVALPAQIEELQRRQTYRVPLGPADSAARPIRASRIPAYAVLRDRPSKSQEFEVRLLDLSPLGMGLICLPRGSERITLAGEQRLRLAMPGTSGEEILLGGCVKHASSMPGDRLRIGIEFRQAEYDVKDRQNLAALIPILSQLQRTEARQSRGTDVPAAA